MDMIAAADAYGVDATAPVAVSWEAFSAGGMCSRVGGFGVIGTPPMCVAVLAFAHTEIQGKPRIDWRPGVFAEPVDRTADEIDLALAYSWAARRHIAHPATVIRTRHRCRSR